MTRQLVAVMTVAAMVLGSAADLFAQRAPRGSVSGASRTTRTRSEGTLVVVRLAADVSSETAHVGDRVQGFLDQDLAANGRLVAPRGQRSTAS